MPKKLSTEEISLAQALVIKANRIVVTSHKNPDGDAAGSAFSMSLFLASIGKNVTTILPDGLPEFLQWLPGYERLVQFDTQTEEAKAAIDEADLIFVLDYNALHRTGTDMQVVLENATAQFILIDHHQMPGDFAVVTYSDTSACSTAELVYHFIEQCYGSEKIDQNMAQNIYCGIMTDSGSFRFPSVTPDTHRVVASLIEKGLDHALVHRQVYDTNMLDRLKLIGYALSQKLEIIDDSLTAYISLSSDELRRHNHRQGDTESLVNQALSIKGVKLAAFFRETNHEVKLSFRSKGSFDVNKFARDNWNGGGHMNAAGAATTLSLPEAIQKFKRLVQQYRLEIINS